ncbi:hypothetical protein [Azospirillum endophyticum]
MITAEAGFVRTLLAVAGMLSDKAADFADILVEGECLGKATHGLALLPQYLREIDSGGMAAGRQARHRRSRAFARLTLCREHAIPKARRRWPMPRTQRRRRPGEGHRKEASACPPFKAPS